MPNLLCFCADPQDLRTGHNIVLFARKQSTRLRQRDLARAVPVSPGGGSSELLSADYRLLFHWVKTPSPGFVSMPDQRRFKNRRISHL